MPFVQNPVVIPPCTSLLHHSQDDLSKVTEQLWPDGQGMGPQKPLSERLEHEQLGKVSQQQSQRHKKHSSSRVGLIRPFVRLVRQPIKTLGELYAESEWAFDGARSLELARRRETQVLYSNLKQATTLDDWYYAAAELDRIEGNNLWKLEDTSPHYNASLVLTRLKQLDDARNSRNVKTILFLIRTSLARGLGGMSNLQLYQHSHVGTKHLIEDYISSAKETLSTLLQLCTFHSSQPDSPDPRYVLEQLLAARQAFGRSALLLSGGGTFGMNHIGVVKTLWHAQLLPRIISGSSAGSIVCAVLCTKTDEEIPETLRDFAWGDMSVFNENHEDINLSKLITRFLKFGSFFDIANLVRVMKSLLGDLTFQEAYNRTRRILNICVSSASLYELPRLLNYVTAPNVLIWSAVATSCSVPVIFSASSLMAKDPRTGCEVPWNPTPQRWIDGSVDNDIPITRLAELFNVNHFIVSQVNPHVVPFLGKEHGVVPNPEGSTQASSLSNSGWMNRMADLAKGEVLHRLHVLSELGVFPTFSTKIRSVLSQRYSGDITILPEVSYMRLPNVLSNPTPEFMTEAILAGERATWPQLSRIQNRCALELALDDAVRNLRARVVFSPSQVDMRLSAMSSTHGSRIGEDRLQRRRPGIERGRSAGSGRASAVVPTMSTATGPASAGTNLTTSGTENRRRSHRPLARRQLSWLSLSARRPRRLSATAATMSADFGSSSAATTPAAATPSSLLLLHEPPSPSYKKSSSAFLPLPPKTTTSCNFPDSPTSSTISRLSMNNFTQVKKNRSHSRSFGGCSDIDDDRSFDVDIDGEFDGDEEDDDEAIQITNTHRAKRNMASHRNHNGFRNGHEDFSAKDEEEVICHTRLNSSDQSPPASVLDANSSDEADGEDNRSIKHRKLVYG